MFLAGAFNPATTEIRLYSEQTDGYLHDAELLGWSDIARSGPSDNRVDVVIMGDGYTLRHLKSSFDSRTEDLLDAFEREPALEEYFSYFNFIRAAVVSNVS